MFDSGSIMFHFNLLQLYYFVKVECQKKKIFILMHVILILIQEYQILFQSISFLFQVIGIYLSSDLNMLGFLVYQKS